MKLNFKDFGRKCQMPVMLAAGSVALPIMICVESGVPAAVKTCILLSLAYILLAWITIWLPGKLRIPVGVIFSAGLIAAGAMLLPMGEAPAAWAIPVLLAVMLMGGLRIGGWNSGQELHPLVGALCLLAHLAAQLMVNVDKINRGGELYGTVTPVLTACFILFGAMAMLELNRISLNSAVNGRSAVPTAMKRKNWLLTGGLMALTLLIAAVPAVIRAIERAWQWLMTAIILLVQLLMRLFPQNETQGADGGGGNMLEGLVGETQEQSLLGKIIEKVMIALALIVVAVLLVIALRIVWKKLKVLMKRLWEYLNRYMVSSSEDYVDEVTATRDDSILERLLRREKRRALKKRVDESALTPKERIRYRYLLAWLKHPEWTSDRTARENLSEDLAQIYERARYSSHEITAQDAETFAQKSDMKKR